MQNTGTGTKRARGVRPRYIFQVESGEEGTVLRVLDTRTEKVFREIPIEEFLAYARKHRNVTPFLLGQIPS